MRCHPLPLLKLFAIAASLLAARLGVAAPQPVLAAQKDATGVTLRLQTGVMRLEVCDDRTIHVTAGATETLPEKKEFVVNRQWTAVPFEWREEPAKFTLHTARMGVEVDRATGVLAFIGCLAYYPLIYWSVMGMETGLFTLITLAAFGLDFAEEFEIALEDIYFDIAFRGVRRL